MSDLTLSQVDRMLTPEEAADVLQCSAAHVKRHAAALGGVKLGRLWRFPSGVIRRMADVGRCTGVPAPVLAVDGPLHDCAHDGPLRLPVRPRRGARDGRPRRPVAPPPFCPHFVSSVSSEHA